MLTQISLSTHHISSSSAPNPTIPAGIRRPGEGLSRNGSLPGNHAQTWCMSRTTLWGGEAVPSPKAVSTQGIDEGQYRRNDGSRRSDSPAVAKEQSAR